MVSLSELTAEYYRLRAETERILSLNADDFAEKEQRLRLAAEFEALFQTCALRDLPEPSSGPADSDDDLAASFHDAVKAA